MSKRVRKRKNLTKSGKSIFDEYNFEIINIGLFSLGFFLLWEDWNIKSVAWNIFTTTTRTIITSVRDFAVMVGRVVSGVETSDIIGILLVTIVIINVLNRARLRVITNHPELSSCPSCSGALHRTHRKQKHKTLGVFLNCNIKRYKCRSCSFDGIGMVTGGRSSR